MKTIARSIPLIVSAPEHYAARLATGAEEIRVAQKLRFEIFNVELHEGLEESFATCRATAFSGLTCFRIMFEIRA